MIDVPETWPKFSCHFMILPDARSTSLDPYISLHFSRWCRFFSVRLLAGVDLVEAAIPLGTRAPHNIIWAPSGFKCPCKITILVRARAGIRILVGTRVNIRILVRILTSVRIMSCLTRVEFCRVLGLFTGLMAGLPWFLLPPNYGYLARNSARFHSLKSVNRLA